MTHCHMINLCWPLSLISLVAFRYSVSWLLEVKAQVSSKALLFAQLGIAYFHVVTLRLTCMPRLNESSIQRFIWLAHLVGPLKLERHGNGFSLRLTASIYYFLTRLQNQSSGKTHDSIDAAHVSDFTHNLPELGDVLFQALAILVLQVV
ncbi:uncharacterized protein PHALS_14203 [Plasmopara halstedii]|uniref:Uncharacterized protein n=1 Tax=Plasmopara halstedii TaxID=4781 RepID=A0A0P1ARC9_PLAHL|nr:uncharacterized protein PHALS_14203 [Plasmopara halstedii]CEG43922.1 hypothetical protein PHALS_14203 [Plasmopara halstedii]|eukprot:XP_024580291.1 hypothetical protein PHALS_14203 [Plasmopara halstedii]